MKQLTARIEATVVDEESTEVHRSVQTVSWDPEKGPPDEAMKTLEDGLRDAVRIGHVKKQLGVVDVGQRAAAAGLDVELLDEALAAAPEEVDSLPHPGSPHGQAPDPVPEVTPAETPAAKSEAPPPLPTRKGRGRSPV